MKNTGHEALLSQDMRKAGDSWHLLTTGRQDRVLHWLNNSKETNKPFHAFLIIATVRVKSTTRAIFWKLFRLAWINGQTTSKQQNGMWPKLFLNSVVLLYLTPCSGWSSLHTKPGAQYLVWVQGKPSGRRSGGFWFSSPLATSSEMDSDGGEGSFSIGPTMSGTLAPGLLGPRCSSGIAWTQTL